MSKANTRKGILHKDLKNTVPSFPWRRGGGAPSPWVLLGLAAVSTGVCWHGHTSRGKRTVSSSAAVCRPLEKIRAAWCVEWVLLPLPLIAWSQLALAASRGGDSRYLINPQKNRSDPPSYENSLRDPPRAEKPKSRITTDRQFNSKR